MQLHARNRIESSAQSHAQRKCPTSSVYMYAQSHHLACRSCSSPV